MLFENPHFYPLKFARFFSLASTKTKITDFLRQISFSTDCLHPSLKTISQLKQGEAETVEPFQCFQRGVTVRDLTGFPNNRPNTC